MIFRVALVGALIASLPAFAAILRGGRLERLLALQVVSADLALVFAILAGADRTPYDLDLAIATALLSTVGALALLRFAGGWT